MESIGTNNKIMNRINVNYPSVDNRLYDALREYFYERLGGSPEDFSKWFASIGEVTDKWKMMEKDKEETKRINTEYDVPEWFMWAIHATI